MQGLFEPKGIAPGGVVDVCDPAAPTARRDAMKLLTTAIRAILFLAAAGGFADRLGIASALWSAFVGVSGPGTG